MVNASMPSIDPGLAWDLNGKRLEGAVRDTVLITPVQQVTHWRSMPTTPAIGTSIAIISTTRRRGRWLS